MEHYSLKEMAQFRDIRIERKKKEEEERKKQEEEERRKREQMERRTRRNMKF
jgi:hypothetical protein